eukprot:CAMPEP_0198604244 /NCGR_PEP_ID=MMETSP1462-20131121/152946_1 /TAXON_ID=1333877 /ORGANISM="Brandtodinium nutriculum, Strain RCC3387" /LENGTH=116 /DNA_ID=CAMNT_0044336025 /DNA_START=96 /DNA_END=442 /DNA_ORIENTATION=-
MLGALQGGGAASESALLLPNDLHDRNDRRLLSEGSAGDVAAQVARGLGDSVPDTGWGKASTVSTSSTGSGSLSTSSAAKATQPLRPSVSCTDAQWPSGLVDNSTSCSPWCSETEFG